MSSKYKYKYHLKVESEFEPFYFTYGKIIHKIAEEFVKAKGSCLISEIATKVLKGDIEIDSGKKAPPLPLEYKKRLPDNLRAIKNLTEKTGYEGYTEWSFDYDLNPPNQMMLKGVIDRLINKKENWWIIDYKTTKAGPFRKSGIQLTNDLQLRIYAKVVQKTFGAKAENIKAALYYLEGQELAPVQFSQESLDAAEEELKKGYIKISNHDPDSVVGNVGDHCKRCEYKKRCPFYHE